ncbi:hypothetical protein [Lacticaseibacillus mingshuiensis]|uniref:hypothetical protein n=1 Tax=Lacticaseibacillus mingshuiensis TaxID=2799574 RepID=UPI00194FFDD5|nr:hypothetical protein [Lacticaseibacillus mingshuiensis]
MAKVDLTVHYSGPALNDGRMPITDLAPALLGLSNAIQAIREIEDPSGDPISIDIQATSRGSFVVDLLIANGSDFIRYAADLLNGENSTAFINLTGYISIFSGVVQLIKKMFGHKVRSVIKNQDGQVTLHLDDDTSLTVPASHLRAFQDLEVRKSIEQTVRPLKRSGVDLIEFSSTKNIAVSIASSEADDFDSPVAKSEELQSSTSEVYLQLVSVAFEHGKWKFSDGSSQFFAKIADTDFLTNVRKNEVQFGSTDSLRVRMRTIQTMTEGGNITAEHIIEKVLEHRKGSREIELDFEDPAENSKS